MGEGKIEAIGKSILFARSIHFTAVFFYNFFSETSLFQFHHEGVWLVGQPCALGGPIPVPLVVELHVEFPEDLAEDEAGFGEEEPDDGSEESGVSW